MGAKIIMMMSTLLCAIPFYVIAFLGKNSSTPITFWAGDNKLKNIVKDVKGYNLEMFKLYTFYANIFLLSGIIYLFYEPLGLFVLIFSATVGIIPIYIRYKIVLKKYSK